MPQALGERVPGLSFPVRRRLGEPGRQHGYSWLAMAGLQLAVRTDRLTALVMGGFPPVGGPYAQMLDVTNATHRLAIDPPPPAPAGEAGDWGSVSVALSPDQTRQFVTLYEALRHFDDRAAQEEIDCARLCFAGSADTIDYGPAWGDVQVDIAGPLLWRRDELERLGWQVRLLDGLDHLQAMQANRVLPLIRPWLLNPQPRSLTTPTAAIADSRSGRR
jgi:hypothetical protein